jgi:DNA-binding protein H-NS
MFRTNRRDPAVTSAREGAIERWENLFSPQTDRNAQIEHLQRQREERLRVVASIQKQIDLYELGAVELGFAGKPMKPQRTVEPKYRDPESGVTWSGRGKPPRWIAARDRAAFLIS